MLGASTASESNCAHARSADICATACAPSYSLAKDLERSASFGRLQSPREARAKVIASCKYWARRNPEGRETSSLYTFRKIRFEQSIAMAREEGVSSPEDQARLAERGERSGRDRGLKQESEKKETDERPALLKRERRSSTALRDGRLRPSPCGRPCQRSCSWASSCTRRESRRACFRPRFVS